MPVRAMCELWSVAPLINSQSVGYAPASSALLLATYRALAQLPSTHLPAGFCVPAHDHFLPNPAHTPVRVLPTSTGPALPLPHHFSRAERPASPTSRTSKLPNIRSGLNLFQYCWLALAGISTPNDVEAFLPFVLETLGVERERVKITNGRL